jgi:hypothetical protein
MSDYQEYLEAMRQNVTLAPESGSTGPVVSQALECPTCKTALDERHQVGPGDRAAVMANLGIRQVKLRCSGCNTVFNVTLPFSLEWKASIDIPGWGTFPGQCFDHGAASRRDAGSLVCRPPWSSSVPLLGRRVLDRSRR